MSRLADLIYRRSRRILLAGGALFLAGVVFGGPVAGILSADRTDFQDPAAENIAATDRLERALGHDAEFGVVTLAPRDRVRELEALLRRTPGVQATASPVSAKDPGLLSADGRTAIVAAATADDVHEADLVKELKRHAPEGVKFGGARVVLSQGGDKVGEDLARAELLAFPLLFLLSLWVFRGVVAASLPLLVGGLSIVVTFVFLRLVNAHVTGLSVFAVNLVTGMGLGLAIDYSLFVLTRYREEMARFGPGREAIARTMATSGKTVLFSSLTIAAAMATLLVFPLRFLYSMGVGGVICAIVAATVALTVLPAILVALGERVDALSPRRWRLAARSEAESHRGGWYRLANAVMRRPGRVALATGAVMLLAGLPFLRVTFVAADHKMLPVGSEARVVAETIQRDFPAAAAEPIRIAIDAPRSAKPAIKRYKAQLRQIEGMGLIGRGRQVGDHTWEIDVLQRGDPLDRRNLDVVDAIRALPAPFPVEVAGTAAAFADQQKALSDRLPIALGILAITTFAILFLMTGSLVLPVKALVMNVLTISAAFGALVVIFQDGLGEGLLDFKSAGGLEATQPLLLFALAFGLATDYGVFLLSRIKEARDSGMGERASVAFGVERTGRVITAAALLFCVAMAAFSTSGVLFIKQMGLGTAIAVAIDATIVRALLVPALMALLGRWNWWAPRWMRRLHERIGLSESHPPVEATPA